MLKKIILPLVLLIFTQQDFYGMGKHDEIKEGEKDQVSIWESINNWVNKDISKNEENEENKKEYPKLWWLWAILDNIPLQYGGSKIWKHGEAYYGLSNGIGFFPSFLNFRWLKIGIIDAHINVINLFLDYIKHLINYKTCRKDNIKLLLLIPITINPCFNIHIISVKILNYIKIKLVAPLTLLLVSRGRRINMVDNKWDVKSNVYHGTWYITYNRNSQISLWYGLLSPRIEISISGIIDYFNGK